MCDRNKYSVANNSPSKMANCNRREFITKLAILSGAALVSCTPLKIILKNYSDEFESNDTIKINNLRAFVTTVIPGVDANDVNLCKIFNDGFYGFENYCGFFIFDICKRSQKMFGEKLFCDLNVEQRTDVILSGLDADATLNKIYTAAIFMSQVSYYSSIYDDENGCELIDFGGSSSFVYSEMFYKNPESYLADQITIDGNYN